MTATMSQPQAARARMSARPTLVLGAVAALNLAMAVPAAAHNPKLSSPYVYTIGDDVARRMQGIFRVTAGLEVATLVHYDRENHNIVVEIIGDTDDVEGAKREIEAFVEAIQEGVIGYAKRRHKIDLTDKDVTLIYYVDSDQGVPVEVVRREAGQYMVPKEEENEGD